MHHLFSLLKVIKTIKVIKNNIAAKNLEKRMNNIDFFYNWGNVFRYAFFFCTFLNLGACLYIFIGRNAIKNWIFLNGLQGNRFFDIYIGAIQYLIETVTTVGYGEIVGNSIKEVLFQIIMLILGTCIYSWLISSISNYVTKKNVNNIKFEEKVQILEEIKLNNPNFDEVLYDKILRLLRYRKYHEEETEMKIVLDSLPNSLKNSLIIEMYKSFINGFLFFKNIENREFIVQVISKLKPVLGIKGDTIVKEGEYIEDIIFVKNGILSLEVWVDLICPEDSIKNYLMKNDFINSLKRKKSMKDRKKENTINRINENDTSTTNNDINHYYEHEINKKKIKILDIRKNEHFGDVFMFLNKKSPLYVRVKSNKVDLLLLKKLDALDISYNYPDIWKTIIKKPLANAKIVHNLTIKKITAFCNFYGIKISLFEKKDDEEKNFFPKYYLRPTTVKRNLTKERKKKIENDFILNENRERINLSLRNYIKSVSLKSAKRTENPLNENEGSTEQNIEKICAEENSQNFISNFKDDNDECFSPKKSRYKCSLFNSRDNDRFSFSNAIHNSVDTKNQFDYSFKRKTTKKSEKSKKGITSPKNIRISKKRTVDDDDSPKSRKSTYRRSQQKTKYKIVINNPDEVEHIIKDDDNRKTSKKAVNFNYEINDEIYPGETFDLDICHNNKPKYIYENKKILSNNVNINNMHEYLTEPVYINNLNIIGNLNNDSHDKKELEEKIKKLEKELNSKKNFEKLEISSSESTLEIDSSYENINKISNNQYISNNFLRDITKEFIKSKINNSNNDDKHEKSIHFNSTLKKAKRKSSVSNEEDASLTFDKIFNKKNKNNRSRSLVLSNLSSNKSNNIIKNKNKSNRMMAQQFFQSKVATNEINQVETFKNKIKHFDLSVSNLKQPKHDSSQHSMTNDEKSFLGRRKSQTYIEEEEEEKESINKKKRNNDKKGLGMNAKKKKKKNELDIITLNIQKSSQNLNQPDIFYAGLFSQLLFKGTSNENSNHNTENNKNNENEPSIKLDDYNSEEMSD